MPFRPPISQNWITDKLIKYLRLQKRDYTFIEKIEHSGGLCFGFSLCYSSMDAIGKLDWWMGLLSAIALWDGEKETLQTSTPIEGNIKVLTLEQIFDRFINDIVSNHFQLEGISDNDIYNLFTRNAYEKFNAKLAALKPNSFFEISDSRETHKIQDSLFIAKRPYTETGFASLITQEKIEGNLCIIIGNRPETGGGHACALRFKKGTWYFYDPYVDEGEKEFDNKNDLAKHIFKSLTNEIQIQLASFKKNAFANDEEKTEIFCQNLKAKYSYSGLFMMLKFAPEQFDYLFANINDDKIRKAVVEALSETIKNRPGFLTLADLAPQHLAPLFQLAKQHQDIKDAIVQAILSKSVYSESHTSAYWRKPAPGLFMFASLAPSQLKLLFELAEEDQKIRDAIADTMITTKISNLLDTFISNMIDLFKIEDTKILLLQNENDWRVLRMILLYCPHRFKNLITLAETNTDILNALVDALLKQNNDKKSVLDIITETAPTLLEPLFGFAEKSQKIRDVIATFLQKQDSKDNTTLHALAKSAPRQLEHLFRLADKDNKIMAVLAEELLKRNEEHTSTLEMIAKSAPTQLRHLFDLARKHPEIQDVIAKALPSFRPRGQTTLHVFAEASPDQLTHLFKLAGDLTQIRTSLAEALLKITGRKGMTAFDAIAEKAPKQLENLFQLAKTHQEMRDIIETALTMKQKSTQTTLLTIAKSDAEQLMHLFRLAESDEKIKVAIINTFVIPNSLNETVLSAIAKSDEKQLKELFDLAEKDRDLLSAITTVIPIHSIVDDSALGVMAQFSPTQLERLITFAETNEDLVAAIAKTLPMYKMFDSNKTTLQLIAETCPKTLGHIMKLAVTNVKIQDAINAASEIIKDNIKNNRVSHHNAEEAVRFLMLCHKHLKLDFKEDFSIETIRWYVNYIEPQTKESKTPTLFQPARERDDDTTEIITLLNDILHEPDLKLKYI